MYFNILLTKNNCLLTYQCKNGNYLQATKFKFKY